MRKALLVAAALVAAVIFFVWTTLPPRPQAVSSAIAADVQRRTIAGAYHVHSTRSDGAGDKAAIAAAAARAGLAFVILTDHGDGMRQPDPPLYVHGVLCIDGVEVSTTGGHYVALDMKPSPYPLGGEPAAVVEDVHRLGGFGIAAHPDSPRAELAWTDWSAPIDGIEWLSADSEWRDESTTAMARVLAAYPFRPGPAMALMLDRPAVTLKRWGALAAARPVVGLAAHDAHGGIGRGMEEGGRRRAALGGIPSYEGSFRTFSNRVILASALSGDASADARLVLDAIEHGRVFTVIDAIASPGFVDIRGSTQTSRGDMGTTLQGSEASISAQLSIPSGGRLYSVRDGEEAELPGDAASLHTFSAGVGATRFEVRVEDAPGTPPVPWLVTNPIRIGVSAVPPVQQSAGPPVQILGPDAAWHVEKDPGSTAAMTASGGGATLDYALRSGDRASQFAALALDLPAGHATFSDITVTASAAKPLRVSIQLRYEQAAARRWGTSMYVDSTPRDLTVPVNRMRPLDRQTEPAPDPALASALLVVVDLTNAHPGDSNTLHLGPVAFTR
jgi:hypothetical protein